MTKLTALFVLLMLTGGCDAFAAGKQTVTSPDGKIAVAFRLTTAGEPVYSVSYSGTQVLKNSKLGIIRSDEAFDARLALDSVSRVQTITDTYTMLHGKRLNCVYTGSRRVFYLKNAHAKPMEIIFQVSNDGVAFRYHFPGSTKEPLKIYRELTTFHIDTSARGFLQPCDDARVGWNFASPSYEEYYQLDVPAGTASPKLAGWVMPALFRTGRHWVALTETAVDTAYCGTRLSQLSPDGEYSVQFPQPQESKSGGPVEPQSVLPWLTPWRVIALSDHLGGLVESTLETDLATPAAYSVSSWLHPGIASWSWIILKDEATVYDMQKRYIDFASSMHWKYCLIDALWDAQIGYEKIKDLADYAKTKNVGLLLWYNSAGDWNTVSFTPRDKLVSSKSRRAEFEKLSAMGISGVKIDFFGGDGQSMMKYYIDILNDARDYHLSVNFHGATFPRSWHRTYPNLVSMEAIKGEEYVTFSQYFADQQPSHCAVIPFARNLFDPMDFTPVNFSGIPHITRRTSAGFEIALSVLFTSGVQHIAETPDGMAAQPEFVRDYMRTLPETWDDVKFIDGYPGKYVVLARKKGDTWYVAGINGENSPRMLTLDLSFMAGRTGCTLIADSAEHQGLAQQSIVPSKAFRVTMLPHGGFVMK